MDEDLVKKLREFRFRKETNNAAIVSESLTFSCLFIYMHYQSFYFVHKLLTTLEHLLRFGFIKRAFLTYSGYFTGVSRKEQVGKVVECVRRQMVVNKLLLLIPEGKLYFCRIKLLHFISQ